MARRANGSLTQEISAALSKTWNENWGERSLITHPKRISTRTGLTLARCQSQS